ncbi:MAG: DUF2726 domain-containing protein [Patescibacteria group bacterium]
MEALTNFFLIVLALLVTVVPVLLLILATIVLVNKNSNKEQKQKDQLVSYYEARGKFFTKSEYIFFSELEKQNKGKYYLFSKVRLEDIVQVKPTLDWQTKRVKRNSIRSRHIDFVLVDKSSGEVVKAIELDGYSHNGDKQKDSDNKKDRICEQAGIELIQVLVGNVLNCK